MGSFRNFFIRENPCFIRGYSFPVLSVASFRNFRICAIRGFSCLKKTFGRIKSDLVGSVAEPCPEKGTMEAAACNFERETLNFEPALGAV
jgi:hypothetical protein